MIKMSQDLRKYISIFLLSLILLGGLWLRIYKLGSHDLWFDEAITSYIAGSIEHIPFDKNPPLYYILIHFWTKFFGNYEFQLRFLSAICGTASIFMLYKIGRLLLDKKAGLISAFLLSISPIHIWYSQEARGYTLSIFTILVAIYFFISALRKNKPILWVLFAISSAISLYSSYYFLFIIMGEFLVLLAKRYRRFIGRWMICNFFILVSFLPFLRFFLNQINGVKGGFWINAPTLKSIFISFESFNVGYNANEMLYLLSTVLFLALFICGIAYCLKNCKESLIFLLSFSLFPIAVIFVISQWIPIYIDRQLILYSPFYYIMIAIGIAGIRRRAVIKIATLSFIFILSALSLRNYFSDFMPASYPHHIGTYTKKPFKPAVNYVKGHYKEGDVIVHSNPSTTVTFEYYWNIDALDNNYYPASSCYFFIPSKRDDYWQRVVKDAAVVKNSSKRNARFVSRILNLRQDIRQGKFKRIWFVSSTWERSGGLDENSLAVKEFLEKRYIAADHKEFDGIFTTLYVSGIN